MILLHGGRNFSAGADITAWLKIKTFGDKEKEYLRWGNGVAVKLAGDFQRSKKPIVAVVRGVCIGVMFCFLAYADFVYVAPNARFTAPFMQIKLGPEAGSSYMFPKIFGPRLGTELLMCDKWLNAKTAVQTGFASGMIDKFDSSSDWISPDIIPAVPKLLATDSTTLLNCKHQLILARDPDALDKVIATEHASLVN